jgi:hypothetical protein
LNPISGTAPGEGELRGISGLEERHGGRRQFGEAWKGRHFIARAEEARNLDADGARNR